MTRHLNEGYPLLFFNYIFVRSQNIRVTVVGQTDTDIYDILTLEKQYKYQYSTIVPGKRDRPHGYTDATSADSKQ